MMNSRIKFLFTLYLIGRKVRGHYKHKNEDGMLNAVIFSLLLEKKYTVSELAVRLSTKLSAISEKIIELEKQELVSKTQQEDGREFIIDLTEAGREKIHSLMIVMREHCTEMTNKLTDDEVKTLLSLLKKIAD